MNVKRLRINLSVEIWVQGARVLAALFHNVLLLLLLLLLLAAATTTATPPLLLRLQLQLQQLDYDY